jgi:transcriptional regulator with XRE-family HTH domain
MIAKVSFTPAQCRAARALLNWSQKDLSEASLVGTKTIADYERGTRAPYDRTLRDLRETFEAAGIEFTNGDTPGLRLNPSQRPRKAKK